ncbi:hypothetical protein Tco_0959392 [Tanacetum coccineum]
MVEERQISSLSSQKIEREELTSIRDGKMDSSHARLDLAFRGIGFSSSPYLMWIIEAHLLDFLQESRI